MANNLDMFWNSSDEDFPTMNPSKGVQKPVATPAPVGLPEMPAAREVAPSATPKPEPQTFLGKVKDRAIGALKGLGKDIVGTGEIVASQGPKIVAQSINPLGRFVPGADKTSYGKAMLNKGKELVTPSNETQQKGFDNEQLATLLTPLVGAKVASLPGRARELEEISLRLTATEKRDLGTKLEAVKDWLVKNDIVGNPTQRLEKAQLKYEQTEDQLQNFFTKEAAHVKIPRESYVSELNLLKTRLMANQRDNPVIDKQIDEAIDSFKKNYKDTPLIPLKDFNEWKRSVMKDAFNKAGLKVRDDVEFAIGDAAKGMIETYTKGLKIDGKDISEFNQEYGRVIEARKLLYKAEDRDQIGMLGKIMATSLFGGVGGGVGGMAGFAAGGPGIASLTGPAGFTAGVALGNKLSPVLAGTAMRSNISHIYESLAPLEPAARRTLGLLLLAPARAKEFFQGDETSDAPLETEEKMPVQYNPESQGVRSLDQFIEK